MKSLITTLTFMLMTCLTSYGQCGTYTTSASGDYFTGANWVDGLMPPHPIPNGVTVDVEHDMTINLPLENNGSIDATGFTLTIQAGGTYGGSGSMMGDVVNSGTVSPGIFAPGIINNTLAGLTTKDVISITATTAESGGDICYDGGSAVTARGVCWSTSMSPTTADMTTTDGSGTGSYTSSLTGLTAGTTYYVRAYATNGVGTSYGQEKSFTIPSDVTNSGTGKTWMDRNLGATQVATSSTDSDSYGDLYQWGRAADGHESRTSGTTSMNATTAVPNGGNPWDGLFITENSSPFDWLSPQDNNLWQGVNGTNNPCPAGYRLPTDAEWDAERLSWPTYDAAGAFASPLKLPVAGYRHGFDGSLYSVGSSGYYWSSTVDGFSSRLLYFDSSDALVISSGRVYGFSVRCLKD